MAPIIAEFSYWFYGEFSKKAMVSRPEVNASDVEKVAMRYAVNVDVHKTVSHFLMLGRLPGRYNRIIVRVTGDSVNEVRGCVREIILLYGRPDEVPFAFSPSRRAGKTIVDSLLRDYPSR